MQQDERDIYLIPPNFIEGGTLLGGMFKTRNVVEAGILAAVIASPEFEPISDHTHHHPMFDRTPGRSVSSGRYFRQQPFRLYSSIHQLSA